MNFSFLRAGMLAAAAFGGAVSVSAQVLVGPSPYLSFADSPFSGPGFSYFHLENFEDNVFTPGWTANPGWVRAAPGPLTDSVDADDGAIDGSGAAGGSFYSGNISSTLSITFDASVLGALPTHVGVVWTDVGIAFPTSGFGDFRFEAFDSANLSLGAIGPYTLGDGSAAGGTFEDRFFGITSAGGIARIELSSTLGGDADLPASGTIDWEVDHLQYGRISPAVGAVPEPSTTGILAAAVLLLGAGLRSRRRFRFFCQPK
ncbi:MAG TPA: PEP-CTERM sorting domain-containing protein [Opitutaceae bacterium]|nr:PEP-CTERM sorting domain-containing protein [Opitutaceae bacterium]